jgi:hypothetical protein
MQRQSAFCLPQKNMAMEIHGHAMLQQSPDQAGGRLSVN